MMRLERSLLVAEQTSKVAPRRASWLRPAGVLLVMAALGSRCHTRAVDDAAPSRSASLASALRASGLSCDEDDVVWVDGPSGLRGAIEGGARALVRASEGDAPADLYIVRARLSPEGAVLDVGAADDLTRTPDADESRPLLHGTRAAYTTRRDAAVTSVHTLDLSGRSPWAESDWSRRERWQAALTNLQQTGQVVGVRNRAFPLDPIAKDVALAFRDDGLLAVDADGRKVVIEPVSGAVVEGAGWVRESSGGDAAEARPQGLVPWAVDRVRAMPVVGSEGMQWIKMVAFTALDWIERARSKLGPDTSARDVASDLGLPAPPSVAPSFVDPEIGFPPPPMKPVLKPALPGEGQWIALDGDPFVPGAPGLPCPFVTSFLRTDPERRDTRIYVTLWDPRQVALHMMAGTVEPVSESGEAGPGRIPRVPEVMQRVVAGFNGGFQAMHGEYGMQVDDVEFLPPKPYAATVMELRDGSTAFGAWPRNPEVPAEIQSYRQNLTALVQNDRFNPWGRYWWGGTPPGWQDMIHTTRSGVCLTKENFVGYFFGNEISAEVLAQAMLAARCTFGIHLDMNPGLVGFEFYDVEPAEAMHPLGRPLQPDWEFEGPVTLLPAYRVRARRMVRSMVEVNFPKYIHLDSRDFFYLTERTLLPGPELAVPGLREPGEGRWRLQGLPQHGFPYAVATTYVRLDPARPGAKARVLRVDPRGVRPAGSAGTHEDTPTVVSFFGPQRPPREGEVGVWQAGGGFFVSRAPPVADATLVAVGAPLAGADAGARAGVGVRDDDGMLEWVEIDASASPIAGAAHAIDALLVRDGCRERALLPPEATARLGGSLDLEATPAPTPPGPSARFVRATMPGAHAMFEDTPIVPLAVWQPLQMQRVRYFPKPKAPSSPASASPAASSAAPKGANLH